MAERYRTARCHLKRAGQAHAFYAVLLQIGFTEPHGFPYAGELLPRRSTLTQNGRYISVALSLGSPPAAVSRYSCSMELGLSSDTTFRFIPATAQSARKVILY